MSQELTPFASSHGNADQGTIADTPSSPERGEAGNAEVSSLRATNQLIVHARTELGRVISGQRAVIEEVLMAVLCQGHALLEGVPGIAKTLIVKALGRLLGLEFQRVQATPDLMPADILGTSILRPGTDTFSFHPGPVFTDLLLVDEINRMPPRTQAALLECMEERQVTSDGVQRPLPGWFTVFATQNPVDFEGTYPLPEAQLDRFLLKIRVAYPSEADERQILERHHASIGGSILEDAQIAPLPADLLAAARAEVRKIRIEPELYGYILALARRTREWPTVLLGASPRAALSVMLVAQASAAFDGRDYLVPDDVKRAVAPVLRHRVILKPEAELEGFDADRALADVIAAVPVPRQ
jgi:MoxR-like ATPase